MTHQSEDSSTFLTTEQLAGRWSMHRGALERMRKQGKGPRYIKLMEGKSGTVRYRLSDVQKFENGK